MKRKISRNIFITTMVLFAMIVPATTKNLIQEKVYKIGDRGPAGWVFYDKGSYSDGWRYLEAASLDDTSDDVARHTFTWSSGKDIVTDAAGTEIGSGKANTEKIIKAQGDGKYAAALCSGYNACGENDWFLPSKDELALMFKNLAKMPYGRFNSGIYWSSSEAGVEHAWGQFIGQPENNHIGYSKYNRFFVRPVRAF